MSAKEWFLISFLLTLLVFVLKSYFYEVFGLEEDLINLLWFLKDGKMFHDNSIGQNQA
jgi:hypothetical protein